MTSIGSNASHRRNFIPFSPSCIHHAPAYSPSDPKRPQVILTKVYYCLHAGQYTSTRLAAYSTTAHTLSSAQIGEAMRTVSCSGLGNDAGGLSLFSASSSVDAATSWDAGGESSSHSGERSMGMSIGKARER